MHEPFTGEHQSPVQPHALPKFKLPNYRFDYSEVIRPYHASLFNRVAQQANKKYSLDAVWEGAKRGYTLEEQDELSQQLIAQQQASASAAQEYEARMAELTGKAQQLAGMTVDLDDEQFRSVLGEIQKTMSSGPAAPSRPDLQAPNWQQGLAAVLGAIFARPEHKLDVLSAPLQHGLQVQQRGFEDDVRRYQIEDQDHQRRLQFLDGLAEDELRLAISDQAGEEKRLEREFESVQGEMRNLVQQRGQDQMLSRTMWADLNNARGSVAGIKAGIAALEGSGVALPKEWEKVKADLIAEAEREESTKNEAQRWQKNESLIQGYMAKLGDPNRVQAARELDGRMAISLMDPNDPRVAIIEAELPNLRKASVKQQLDTQKIAESQKRVLKIAADTKVSEKKAKELDIRLNFLPELQLMQIARGWASIENIKSMIGDRAEDNRRGWAALDQQKLMSFNDDIRLSLETLRREDTAVQGEIGRLRKLQSAFEPGDEEYEAYEGMIAEEQAKSKSLQDQMKSVRKESSELGDMINPSQEKLQQLKTRKAELEKSVESALKSPNVFQLATLSGQLEELNEVKERLARVQKNLGATSGQKAAANKRLEAMTPKQGVNLNGLTETARATLFRVDDALRSMDLKATITSAKRAKGQQASLSGGKPTKSPHLDGRAVDFVLPGDMAEIAKKLRAMGFDCQFERKGQKNKNGSIASGDHIHINL